MTRLRPWLSSRSGRNTPMNARRSRILIANGECAEAVAVIDVLLVVAAD
ncbi:hypothetical protein [Rathayibacter toxicus]|nr:hypothetical protein [Rathayibacter toxicus]QOD07973.1 hypothetical protein AYW78_08950 [Rathayibacter toxicus]